MKTVFLLILASGFVNAQNVKLEISLTGFDTNFGKVKIGLYNSEGLFLKAVYKSLSSEIKNKTPSVTFSDLPKGDYAISVFHDENNNGVLDKNMFGIPSEDFAASNNAKGMMGPPKYSDARFTLESNSKINIVLNN